MKRVSMNNARMHRFVLAHLLTVVGEWAAIVGILVHAYRWGGSSAVGFVALAVHVPTLVFAPLAAHLTARHRAHSVRLAGFAVQAVALAGAAIAAALDLPSPAVAALVVLGLGAINTLRPTGAVLLPTIARSTEELVGGNLRVSYCDSVSGLIGPLVAAALGGIGGPTAVFIACAAGSAIAVAATAWRPSPLALAHAHGNATPPRRVMRAATAELRERKWAIGVLGVSSARNLVIGAFDVLLVVVALQALELGDRGPGLLSALVGAGAVVSMLLVTFVVRRAQLRRALTGGLVATAAMLVGFGFFTSAPVAFVVLPLLGMCLSSMENLSRMLLQRSTDPRSLGPLFACLGLVGGIAQVAGVGIAQGLMALAGLHATRVGAGPGVGAGPNVGPGVDPGVGAAVERVAEVRVGQVAPAAVLRHARRRPHRHRCRPRRHRVGDNAGLARCRLACGCARGRDGVVVGPADVRTAARRDPRDGRPVR